ncbi:hypothetical protein BDV93DRAFT_525296 [Ceratobasidium sp. AG-I]|nr:hypothetical protein BDV93DRAFT_525296 [Ceratobasidium sp. AG-I]
MVSAHTRSNATPSPAILAFAGWAARPTSSSRCRRLWIPPPRPRQLDLRCTSFTM